MKRYGNLFDTITSFSNLQLASEKARRGKRMKEGCASFEMNREEELWRLYDELHDGTWQPGNYREFTIYERTPRRISAAPYRDRVVHHASVALLNLSLNNHLSMIPMPATSAKAPMPLLSGLLSLPAKVVMF